MTVLIFACIGICFVALAAASILRRNREHPKDGLLDIRCQHCKIWINPNETRCPYCRQSTRRHGIATIVSLPR